MKQKIQKFVILSEKILSESGELKLRKSWNSLCIVAQQLSPIMVQLAQRFDPKYALLLLLSCGNESDKKNSLYSMVFRKILSRVPNDDLIYLLQSINQYELSQYLLPFLYEKGDIGSIATYLAARLGLKVKSDSIEYFLASREWTQEDLVNLSFLILIDEKDSLIMNLDSSYNVNPQEVYLQFLNVLNASNITNPVLPELQTDENQQNDSKDINNQSSNLQELNSSKIKSNQNDKLKNSIITNSNIIDSTKPNNNIIFQRNNNNVSNFKTNNNKPVKNISSSLKSSNNVLPTNQNLSSNTKNITKGSFTEFESNEVQNDLSISDFDDFKYYDDKPINKNNKSKTTNNTTNNKVKNDINLSLDESLDLNQSDFDSENIKDYIKKPSVFISLAVIFIFIIYTTMSTAPSIPVAGKKQANVSAPQKDIKMPSYWLDAVTNKKITPRYMEADIDYRMGELYLTRNMYNEAIQFFQSALKIEPNHYLAKLRWGYSELMQGNYFASIQLLNEVRKADPKLQNVNLYLARNYSADNKFDKAEKYYYDEYRYNYSLTVGMEYANFLAKIGEIDKAMTFLSELQEKNPGKMLILDNLSTNKKQKSKK